MEGTDKNIDSDNDQFFDCEDTTQNTEKLDIKDQIKETNSKINNSDYKQNQDDTKDNDNSSTTSNKSSESENLTLPENLQTFKPLNDESNPELQNETLTDQEIDDVMHTDQIKEENTQEEEDLLTEEEKEELRKEAVVLKESGNKEFKDQKHQEAIDIYTEGIRICPKCFEKERSILFSNRAACYMAMNDKEKGILDCNEAIKLDPNYVRALLRRAQLQEETDKLDESLKDYQHILELDPSIVQARQACARLPDKIKERNEKLKDEMIGKLKDLGNVVLNKFGLSTNNFQMQQNPDTGGYNIQFVQNPTQN